MKTSILLQNKVSTKIDTYLLDSYALKKYKKLYSEVKLQVNQDIKNLSKDHNTVTLKDIRYLITLELLTKEQKSILSNEYNGYITII